MINYNDYPDKDAQEAIQRAYVKDSENNKNKLRELIQKIHGLRSFVWGVDIPSPSCPEYIELHDIMQKIYREIDSIIDWSEK